MRGGRHGPSGRAATREPRSAGIHAAHETSGDERRGAPTGRAADGSWPGWPPTVALATALGLAACSGDSGRAVRGRLACGPAASEFWVDPGSAAARQIEQWRSEGRTDEAAALEKIARQPVAIWPTARPAASRARWPVWCRRPARPAVRPVLTAYNIPNRDCGQYSSGGAGDEGAYREWLDAFARGMGGTRSVVILEPDALPQTLTNCEGQGEQEGREELLAEAVRTLQARGRRGLHRRRQPGLRHRHQQARRRAAQGGRLGRRRLRPERRQLHGAPSRSRRTATGSPTSSAAPATSSTPAATATAPTTGPSSRPGATRRAVRWAPRPPATPARRRSRRTSGSRSRATPTATAAARPRPASSGRSMPSTWRTTPPAPDLRMRRRSRPWREKEVRCARGADSTRGRRRPCPRCRGRRPRRWRGGRARRWPGWCPPRPRAAPR